MDTSTRQTVKFNHPGRNLSKTMIDIKRPNIPNRPLSIQIQPKNTNESFSNYFDRKSELDQTKAT